MHDDLAAKIAALNALRSTFDDAWVDAQIAALRAETAPQLSMSAGDGGTVTGNLMVSAGDGALVLHNISIAEGGSLVIGGGPVDLPPAPQQLQEAVATYLRTLLERYQPLPQSAEHGRRWLSAGPHRPALGVRRPGH